jgi:hypothetical protein
VAVDAVADVVGVAAPDGEADADGPKGTSDADGADDEACGPAGERLASPALDGLGPHEYTISRITRSNPPSTIARRRQYTAGGSGPTVSFMIANTVVRRRRR